MDVPVTFCWANLHGMWILVPLATVALAIALTLDHDAGWRRHVLTTLGAGLLSLVVASVTPIGPQLVYWPLVVRSAANDISEWQPTSLTTAEGLAFLALLFAWVAAAARTSSPVGRGEIGLVLLVFCFGLVAGRNLAPASILLAPLVARRLQGSVDSSLDATNARVNVAARIVGSAVIGLGLLLGGAVIQSKGAVSSHLPTEILSVLREQPGPVRVLNDYNVGGYLTGEGAPQISVAIDGRTDVYDPGFVQRYLRMTSHLTNWRRIVHRLRPDAAVLQQDSALAEEMVNDGWRESLTDSGYVLLFPPA